MTARYTRLGKDRGPWALLFTRRKPNIQPMSREEERINAELHRRRELARLDREAAQATPACDQQAARPNGRPQVLRSANGGNSTEDVRADARTQPRGLSQ